MDVPLESPTTPRRPLPVPQSTPVTTHFPQHHPTPSRLERLGRTLSTLISPSHSASSSISYSAVSAEEEDMASSAVAQSPRLVTDADKGARRRSWGQQQSQMQWDPLQAHMQHQSEDPFAEDYVPSSYRQEFAASSISNDDSESLRHITNPSQANLDPENPLTPNARRRTLRYSVSPSPLKKTGTVLTTMGRNLRRVSLRVVNLHNDPSAYSAMHGDDDDDDDAPDMSWAANNQTQGPLRGRTLGFLGPHNPLRLFLYHLIHNQWTELIVLLAIILNATVLTIQAARSVTLDEVQAVSAPKPPGERGYFHTWEDWVIFVLFVGYTIEALARISITGFLLDPEIPISALFASPFRTQPALPPGTSSGSALAPTGPGSSVHAPRQSVMPGIEPPRLSRREASDSSSYLEWTSPNRPGVQPDGGLSPAKGPLTRGLSLGARMETLARNVKEPFALKTASSSDSAVSGDNSEVLDEKTGVGQASTGVGHSRFQSNGAGAYPPTSSEKPGVPQAKKQGPLRLPFALSLAQAQSKTERNVPYLRQSWGRIDLVAIIGFWTTFALSVLGLERGNGLHIGVFRAMSVLRCGRLLGITSGTTTIMHSLKTARPLLASVAYFVVFAMILFSIIGIQTFSGSLRRACYLQPTLGEPELLVGSDDSPQTCGGHINSTTLQISGYLSLSNQTISDGKGYICPLGQICKERENPLNNIESFDTIYFAALQVIIIASANGWTPLMYTMMDSEFFVSAFFFIIAVIVLNFWLINLFVAVITNTFGLIRSETKKSAFGAENLKVLENDDEDDDNAIHNATDRSSLHRRGSVRNKNPLQTVMKYSEWFWVMLAMASLGLQASRDVDVSETHETIMFWGELVITAAFDVEIILRFGASLPEWRPWFKQGKNLLDLALCIGTSVIQIPVIRNSDVYPWFTALQLIRFYRVILVVPRMKPLLLAVFGNVYGLINMTLFLLLVNYLAALVGVQLLRGDIGGDETINFGQLFNAFLGVYQVFSSENWTSVLYGATGAELELGQVVIVAIYVTAWMLFSNFIVLQMFIAVINENFDIAEEAKRSKQAQSFWAQQSQGQRSSAGWLRKLNPYRWVQANPVTVQVPNMPANLVLPMKKTLVQDLYQDTVTGRKDGPSRSTTPMPGSLTTFPTMTSGLGLERQTGSALKGKHFRDRSLTMMQRLFATTEGRSDDVPLATLGTGARGKRDSMVDENLDDETERHLEILDAVNANQGGVLPEDLADNIIERRAQKADFIRDHPTYDKTFWIFSQKDPVRRFCQLFVEPAGGERIFGQRPNPYCHSGLALFLLCAVIAGIVVESIATPDYRRRFYRDHGFLRGTWFDTAEVALGIVLLLEFIIKIFADGFVFTPNAYLKSIWNVIDFGILVGLIVNVSTGLIFVGGISRLTRSLKALRALRVITLIERMRKTFQDLIISGAGRIFDAAILAILYDSLCYCTNEYTTTVVGDSFGYLVPRAWDYPAPSTKFSFDDFKSSLLILFEIVSLEGWIDVMGIATSVTGRGLQPQTNANQANAIFFLLYHLLGGVVILTLFISIIIGNFSSKTGSAFLTKAQREWIDLQKLFRRQRPSKRPQTVPTFPFRKWCFERATQKRGWWWRTMSLIFILHIIALMSQTFTTITVINEARNSIFLAISAIYSLDAIVRFIGLGFTSFKADGWNLFDVFVAGGSLLTTIVVRSGAQGYLVTQLQKLFLVAIAFKLVQRTNNLNKLFKTAVASLSSLLSLLALWLILFVFFAIMFLEVFGLTKWGSGENHNQNYSSMGASLVMLAFMSTGEGWNQYMHDYAIEYPRCTNSGPSNSVSDCGSVVWAFALFILWNVLSMYIFVNMFTGVVVENFSYVFQTSGVRSISREEMRAFKKVWATYANPKTGYLERQHFVPFFSKLTGVFEVKIYPNEFQVPNILRACQGAPQYGHTWMVDGIDMHKLSHVTRTIDYKAIRRRRAVYERLYHEAYMSHKKGLGISFTDMLMLLAHHKLIVDKEALVLKDLVTRTQKTKLVADLVNLHRVQSMLLTIHYRRKFLAHLEEKQRQSIDRHDIPSIIVDPTPATPPSTTRDISGATWVDSGSAPSSPSPSHAYFGSPEAAHSHSGAGLRRSHADIRRSSIGDFGGLGSTDLGNRSRDSAMSVEDPQQVLESMQNSMWGDLMQEAEEEEERRR
ncbi:Ion transport protein-domain-containing protein [Flagelloscypha sp. PMI_526]|nr:Ion transport protein-domain-containing protein [Flagelloscypha sp. PMI_526]